MAVKVLPVSGTQDELIDQAIALGDRYTKRLGLMTPAAYRGMAEDGGLLVAVEGEVMIGYALFGLPKRSPHVRLAHLCVVEEHRGKGAARLLVEEIRQRYPQRLGIRAKCRRDYGLSGMWTSLGFVPRGEVRGRGSDGETLDAWWLDLGHPDLFTEVESDALLTVAVDHAVFTDLRGRASESEANESQALDAEWLSDLVELAHTPQLVHDVRDIDDDAERQHQRTALHRLRQLSPPGDCVAERRDRLLTALPEAQLQLPNDDLQRRSLQYVAETSCAGLQVLATRDPWLKTLTDVAWDVARVRIVEPSVVTLHVDELRQAQVYRPADLMGTEFRSGEVEPGAEDELVAFFDQMGTDSGLAFAARLRALDDDTVVWHRELLRDGQGRPVALYVWGLDGRTLTIPMLRTSTHPLEETLVRQVLFLLKRQGRECAAEVVHIADPAPSPAAQAAAGDDGFFSHGTGLSALLVDVCGTAAEVESTTRRITRALKADEPELQPGLSAEVASAVERAWWPAKIMDSHLPSFEVPIEPRWSTELFNVPPTLLPRKDLLGISREHVYYRSPGRRGESVPARLLWYVSSGASKQEGQMIIGSSRLDEVVIDTPEALFARFEHLGVYGLREIQGVATAGRAMALRFSDTEIFPRPVRRKRLDSLAQGLGLTYSPPMSLKKISNALFQAVYQEGHRRT